MKVLISPFKNPFINLALEDFFLRTQSHLPLLFFYVNRPCVVLGRFQNPWLETNLNYLVSQDIWLVRRQSGGGCVFHDEGNLNFSFITPDPLVDRRKHAELLVEAFKRSDIELSISPRNDLWLSDLDGVNKKISGSAFKQTKYASFHHGTFLVSSDLNKLEESLKHTLIPKTTKSISSVRSKVISLQKVHPGVEIGDVIELVSDYLNAFPSEITGEYLSHPVLQESFRNLMSWDWLWGETPLFELQNGITVRKGIVQGSDKKFDNDSMRNELNDFELEQFFPDFSEQHKSSNQIF